MEEKEYVKFQDVLDILEYSMDIAKQNWDGDEVLLDMIVTIRDRVSNLDIITLGNNDAFVKVNSDGFQMQTEKEQK